MNTDLDLEQLKYFLIEKFHQAITAEAQKDEEFHSRGFPSVTGLCYECLRKAYYSITYPEVIIDPEGAIRTWIGKKLHETSILGGQMEVELIYPKENGVIGRIDEYKDGLLIDKKSTRHIPREPYEHHIKQIEYYRLLCERNGLPVEMAALVYINVDTAEIGIFPIKFITDLDEIERELMQKYDVVMKALKTGILPPRKMRTWDPEGNKLICSYCPYYGICLREDFEDERYIQKLKAEAGKEEV
jgi:CRISPR/Cas system-associated exonuclease Cas4 (RecB family)